MVPRWFLALGLACVAARAQKPVRGFAPGAAGEQLSAEARLRKIPDSKRISSYMRRMSAAPHHAGSPGARAVAEFAQGLFREWGLEAKIESFDALIPYPASRSLELVSPSPFRARLQEPSVPGGGDGGAPGQLPAFNAYGGSGDVTAPLVYVNYGTPEDYAWLKRSGVDVRGKIVIARYGQGWRGVKPKVAQQHGAVACILYSDPHEDGFYQGDVYPKGPFRPPEGIQRGSVMDIPLYVGDPLTPGWPSMPGMRRLAREQAQNILRIPVLPVSYGDAARLMRPLGGPMAPEHWRGALGQAYHIGPGPATVHVKVDFEWANRPLYDVIGTLAGAEFPEQWVVYGNHHDAWGPGANDPLSGASVLLETARALAELSRTGWKPRRTIKFALWDGEEFGLIGSTEWVEKHRDKLEKNAVAYINSDTTGRGLLGAAGSPSLEAFLNEVASAFADPKTGQPITGVRTAAGQTEPLRLGSLGAGSDYVAFLEHAGVASLNLGFGGEGTGVYHSAYDTFEWYSRFSDGEFVYARTLSSIMAVMLARLAGATLVPFEFGRLARVVEAHTAEIEKSSGETAVDLGPLRAAIKKLTSAARTFEREYTAFLARGAAADASINAAIFRTERAFLLPGGLPGRPWYRHLLTAPGLYSGYSAQTLPAVRDALQAGRPKDADHQARVAAAALTGLARELESIAESLKNVKGTSRAAQ